MPSKKSFLLKILGSIHFQAATAHLFAASGPGQLYSERFLGRQKVEWEVELGNDYSVSHGGEATRHPTAMAALFPRFLPLPRLN